METPESHLMILIQEAWAGNQGFDFLKGPGKFPCWLYPLHVENKFSQGNIMKQLMADPTKGDKTTM